MPISILKGKLLMKRSVPWILAIAALLLVPLERAYAVADIYQYVDDAGVVHFSNVGVSTGKKLRKVQSTPASRSTIVKSQSVAAATVAETAPAPDTLTQTYADIIKAACNRHGVDPALVQALVKVESGFNPYALSRKGAMGLMQLMPQTAEDMNVTNTFNPHENVDGGVRYLRYLIDRYEGNLALALAAYNSGETAVKKWGTIPPFPETQSYVQKILGLYNGTGISLSPQHYTIYVGYGDDGALLLTDDPSKHKGKNLKRKTISHL